MAIAKSYSAQLIGLTSEIITVEVDISNGLHAFVVVGLGDRAVEEAKDRISAAIKNSGYISPKQKNQKVVISLAPADMRKEGTSFDLAMAVTYLAAAKEIEYVAEKVIFLGELTLGGSIRRVSGLLPILSQAAKLGFISAFIPKDNSTEAMLAEGIKIYAVSSLHEIAEHLSGTKKVRRLRMRWKRREETGLNPAQDMAYVRGNETAKRGLEIAAAGGHNLLMYGPPGTGKTMLAHSFPGILPSLSYEQAVEVTSIHSAAHVLDNNLITRPPFRAPHHTSSYPAVVGGGTFPKPGEITLAHRGVLFLDEFPEFDKSVVEALRQPLEERVITISRAKGVVTFPAHCIFMASMNPCPCGKGVEKGCVCPKVVRESYKRRISGPIADRIDIWINVSYVDHEKLALRSVSAESSAIIRARVTSARKRQAARLKKYQKDCNGDMSAKDIELCVTMEEEAREILKISAARLDLSGRAFHRVIKVAQTIADLVASNTVKKEHILEALQYRQKWD